MGTVGYRDAQTASLFFNAKMSPGERLKKLDKSVNSKFVLYVILIIFLLFLYSCMDVLCPAYTGTSYTTGHTKLPKELRK